MAGSAARQATVPESASCPAQATAPATVEHQAAKAVAKSRARRPPPAARQARR
jgi:hypothetical protein